DDAAGYEQLGDAYVGRVAKQMRDTGAGWAEGEVFEEAYEDVTKVLKPNRLTAVPPELLMVGRVFGLLNGLSKTLHAKTNMLVAFSQLADEIEAQRLAGATNGAKPVAAGATRRLLEA